jgi:hypothetical protein
MFSNKTVIRICAPVYIACIAGWSLVGNHALTIPFLMLIHIASGMALGGINLAITNIGLKLASKDEAIVYIAARNMVNAFIPALAPILGGLMADMLTAKQLIPDFSLKIPMGGSSATVFHLSNWTLFFVFSAILASISLRFLKQVKEEGEVAKSEVVIKMKTSLRQIFIRRHIGPVRAYIPNIFRLTKERPKRA